MPPNVGKISVKVTKGPYYEANGTKIVSRNDTILYFMSPVLPFDAFSDIIQLDLQKKQFVLPLQVCGSLKGTLAIVKPASSAVIPPDVFDLVFTYDSSQEGEGGTVTYYSYHIIPQFSSLDDIKVLGVNLANIVNDFPDLKATCCAFNSGNYHMIEIDNDVLGKTLCPLASDCEKFMGTDDTGSYCSNPDNISSRLCSCASYKYPIYFGSDYEKAFVDYLISKSILNVPTQCVNSSCQTKGIQTDSYLPSGTVTCQDICSQIGTTVETDLGKVTLKCSPDKIDITPVLSTTTALVQEEKTIDDKTSSSPKHFIILGIVAACVIFLFVFYFKRQN